MSDLTDRLRAYAARASDVDHPQGWLTSWSADCVADVCHAADRLDAAEAERDRLRAALAMVEWIERVCPWCGGAEEGYVLPHDTCEGHALDCPRQAALGGPR